MVGKSVRKECNGEHDNFSQIGEFLAVVDNRGHAIDHVWIQEYGTDDDQKPAKVSSPDHGKFIGIGDFLRVLIVIGFAQFAVEKVESDRKKKQSHGPGRPVVLNGPEKRHPFQESQKQGRIADWSKWTTHVAYHEDKEYDVIGLDISFV